MKAVILLASLILVSQAKAVEPATRFRCQGESLKLDVDLYATGHPMGGISMFTGMMSAEFKGHRVPVILSVEVEVSQKAPNGFGVRGTSREPYARSFVLTVFEDTRRDRTVKGELEIRDEGPFPSAPSRFSDLECIEL